MRDTEHDTEHSPSHDIVTHRGFAAGGQAHVGLASLREAVGPVV